MLAFLAVLALPSFDLAVYERPRLIQEADSVLAMEPKTIVTAVNPRSAGGPHDWSSEGDYWWPDPKNPDDPYLQHDGMTNPANFIVHRDLMLAFVRAFDALAAAYRVTGDERYAAAGVKQLHAWYVDPATRMNPNLQYAQAIHGRYTGRGTGVIDTVHFAEVALGVEALRGSQALTPQEAAAVTGWFRDYLAWIRTSKNGIEESNATNNHGTCWALQEAAFAHLVDDQEALADARRRFTRVLLPHQMAPDGSFPQELRRTKSYGYSIFDLDVMTSLAEVLSTPQDDLMKFTLPDGRNLIQGVAFLAPYLADKSLWTKQVRRPATTKPESASPSDPLEEPDVMYWDNWPVRQPSLIFGALSAGRADWLETWKKLDPDPTVEEIRRNLPIRQPVLWVK
jgi:hypothetical protein